MKRKKLKTSEPKSLIQHVETIAVNAKHSKFNEKFLQKVIPDGRVIAQFLGCNEIQSILFSVLFNLNFKNSRVSLDGLAEYMDCSPITVVSYIKDFDQLVRLKVIRRYCNSEGSPHNRRTTSLDNIEYFVNKDVFDALSNEERFIPKKSDDLDLYEFLDVSDRIFLERKGGLLAFDELLSEIQTLLNANLKLEFVKIIKKLNLDDDDLLTQVSHKKKQR